MLPIGKLNFGFGDAENYKKRENKELFNRIFVRTEELDRTCEQNVYFLIGEKGTGKTAYAVYLSNNKYKNNNAALKYLRETEYQKFVSLKKKEKLALSDFTSIWKVILYLLLSQQITEGNQKNKLLSRFSKLKGLQDAIDEFYAKAFAPEIINALSFIDDTKAVAELISKHINLGRQTAHKIEFSESRFQTNLMYIERKFEEALQEVKLSENYILFVDGIDIRPHNINFEDYMECVKGLANAVWSVNSDVFPRIRDSKGRLRVVLLVRPDIFNSLGLQNQNTKIRDNSVLLDWRTTYSDYRESKLFAMADQLLSSQQSETLGRGQAWDHYFPYKIDKRDGFKDDSFISFLKFSYYRPRDIVTMLGLLQQNSIERGEEPQQSFSVPDFDRPAFRSAYSDYLLGEVKDHLSFYYTSLDYEMFLKFFEFLEGKYSFTYDEYLLAYKDWQSFLHEKHIRKLGFAHSSSDMLQFLYNLNVICYVEETDREPLIRWCFRERSIANIQPKVKENLRYEIHYGLGKALNLGGRKIRKVARKR